jgi:hypothetical protein
MNLDDLTGSGIGLLVISLDLRFSWGSISAFKFYIDFSVFC